MSAIYALATLAIVTAFRADTRLTPARTMAALEAAARSALVVAMICGSVGILIAALAVSGATLRSAVLLTELSGGSLFALLSLAGLAALVLGTGLPAVACYTLLAVSVAPALIDLGVPPIGAHLFVLYWGLSNFITPPVGGALYIASSLSASAWAPGLLCHHARHAGLRRPVSVLLSRGAADDRIAAAIVAQTLLAGAAMWAVAAAFVGYCGGRATVVERVLLLVAAVAFVVQGLGRPRSRRPADRRRAGAAAAQRLGVVTPYEDRCLPHILTPRYLHERNSRADQRFASQYRKYSGANPGLTDLDIRFRILDAYPDVRQLLTLAGPNIESVTTPADAVACARIGNDELGGAGRAPS